ncbi:hypothetical protein GCM10008967_30740 [Bacillus carboniphilus]|uniref:DNA mismatch repair protein MutT n=1 Tax=Bacillus carboniphilus TaxID=86663 RepID=A0ABN0WHU1_9BACI
MRDNNQSEDKFTVVGTNINEVKRKNATSGMTYNEVKALLAKNYQKDINSKQSRE